MMRHLLTTLAALALIAPVARADEPTVRTVTMTGPATTAISPGGYALQYELVATLDLPQGYYENLVVTVQRPDATIYPTAALMSHASPTGWTVTTASQTLRTFTITALDLRDRGASFIFRVIGVFLANATRDGTPFDFTVHVTGAEGTDPGLTAPFAAMDGTWRVTATGAANLGWVGNNGSGGTEGATTDGAGNPGLVYKLTAYVGNSGGPKVDAGNTLTLTPGTGWSPDLQFIGIIPNLQHTGQPDATFVGLPAQWGDFVDPITATFPYPVTSTGSYSAAYFRFFAPCSALPLTASQTTMGVTADGIEHRWDGTPTGTPVARTYSVDLSRALTSACGTGGTLTLDQYNGVWAAGTGVDWRMALTWPTGIPAITSAMQVLELPAETTSLTFGTNPYHETNDSQFERWSCNFTGLFGGGQFSPTDFVANRDARCRQLNGTTPGTFMAGDTHLVLYTASTSGLAGATLPNPRWTVYTTIPADWTSRHGNTIAARAWFNGTYEFEGTSHTLGDNTVGNPDDAWERTYSKTLPSSASPTLSPGTSRDLDANGGTSDLFGIIYRGSGLYPQNPVFTWTVPAGFDVTTVSAPSFTGCASPPPASAITLPSPTDRPLVWRFGSAAEPWIMTCDIGNVGMTVRAQPSYPFVHKELRTLVASVDADNTAKPYSYATAGTFRMLVASGEDAQLTGESCWQGGATTYRTTAINRGQQDLTNIELRFTVPPGSTFVSMLPDPVALGLTPPPSFDFSTNNGATWGMLPADPATVTDVRLIGFSIPGLGVDAIRPWFEVTVAPQSAATLTASAWMTSAELGVTPIVYSEVAPCPGTINVQKFIDRDGDGARDAGEAAPGSGFVFGLSQGGTVVYSATTDASGLAIFADVPVGAYDVVELGTPTGLTNPGTWTATSSPSLVVDPGASAAIDFGNGCACEDPNPDDPCTSAGTCADTGECPVGGVAEEDLTSCDSPDPNNPCVEGLCQAGTCTAAPLVAGAPCDAGTTGEPCLDGGACDGVGSCEPVPVVDGDACPDSTPDDPCMGNVCSAGACTSVAVSEPRSCDSPDPSNPCVAGECSAGTCTVVPVSAPTACNSPGMEANPCVMGMCSEGQCVDVPDPTATICPLGLVMGEGGMPLGGGNPCVEGACVEGACTPVPVDEPTVCAIADDDNPCTEADGLCSEGTCQYVDEPDDTPCTQQGLSSPCQEYTCQAGQCMGENLPDGTTCEPDQRGIPDPCLVYACSAGLCAGAEKDCDDQDACTEDYCDPGTGGCVANPPDCTEVPYYAPVVDGTGAVVGAIVCRAIPNEGSAPTLDCELEPIPDGVGQQLVIDPAYGTACVARKWP